MMAVMDYTKLSAHGIKAIFDEHDRLSREAGKHLNKHFDKRQDRLQSLFENQWGELLVENDLPRLLNTRSTQVHYNIQLVTFNTSSNRLIFIETTKFT